MTAPEIPTFPEPAQPAISPHIDLVEAHLEECGRRIGLANTPEGRRRLAARYGELVCWTFPYAAVGDLCACARWLFLTFILDDVHTSGEYDSPDAWEALRGRVNQVVRTGTVGAETSPLMLEFAELAVHTRAQVSDEFYRRLLGHLDLFFRGFTEESRNRAVGLVPDLDSFIELRRASVGMEFGFDLMELGRRHEIPPELYANPRYRRLVAAATDVVAWQNDLHSLPVDVERDDPHNLVLVLEAAHGFTRRAARDVAAERIRARIAEFTAEEEQLIATLDELGASPTDRHALAQSAADMRQWANGCLKWYETTTRYVPPSELDVVDEHAYLRALIV
ncbi:hypothetical protein ACFFQW_38470 [Umezawaea endophytica]|uniref:Terpene synthase n=1 Tax=Umezawaea endophytica TaxID=1654476 RepID=A0A9X2VW88_9PSEU|nr:hypothetical protein [Umezawaea endophytica]MCS7483829.1 hypothetical protein [Umezawaea endophytica]